MDPIQALIKDMADIHGRSRESLLPIMQGVVQQEKYLSELSMIEIAREMDIPAADVYGTATFYSFLETKPTGKYTIRVCKTITCAMKGKNQVLFAIQDMLKIKLGETITIRVFIAYYSVPKDNFSIGVGIRDMQGIEIIHFLGLAEGLQIGGKDIKREIIDFQFENKLTPGNYTVAIGLADMIPSTTTPHYYEIEMVADYCPGCYQFKVTYEKL